MGVAIAIAFTTIVTLTPALRILCCEILYKVALELLPPRMQPGQSHEIQGALYALRSLVRNFLLSHNA
jgi:hypothetical protein